MERAVLALVLLLAASSAFAESPKREYGKFQTSQKSKKAQKKVAAKPKPNPKRDYGNPEVKPPARPDQNLTIRENAYAPGVGMDQYGRPAVLAPANKGQGGYYGDARIERRDAFGPGIHMDQYGRPVVIVPGSTPPR